MAYYARIVDDIVTEVIVVDDDITDGAQFCHDLIGGEWVQTSYNANFRKQYAGIGYTYDADLDIFIAPQPYPSWILDVNHDWQPPTPMPSTGGPYSWNEAELKWVAI